MEPCKHVRIVISNAPQAGEPAELLSIHRCGLKMQGPAQKYKIYQELFKKGLEGSLVNDVCPFAAGRDWDKCPYYQTRPNFK